MSFGTLGKLFGKAQVLQSVVKNLLLAVRKIMQTISAKYQAQ
jgi:hypothetical protein